LRKLAKLVPGRGSDLNHFSGYARLKTNVIKAKPEDEQGEEKLADYT
jgi:hypothetical protein